MNCRCRHPMVVHHPDGRCGLCDCIRPDYDGGWSDWFGPRFVAASVVLALLTLWILR